jgi:hypothetical protein
MIPVVMPIKAHAIVGCQNDGIVGLDPDLRIYI